MASVASVSHPQVVTTVRLALVTRTWTMITIVFNIVTFVSFPLFLFIWGSLPYSFTSAFITNEAWNDIFPEVWVDWATWGVLFIGVFVSILPFLLISIIKYYFIAPTMTEQVCIPLREQGSGVLSCFVLWNSAHLPPCAHPPTHFLAPYPRPTPAEGSPHHHEGGKPALGNKRLKKNMWHL